MPTGLTRAARSLFDRPYLLLTMTALFWGGNIVLASLVAGHVPPVAVSFWRWVGAFIILLPIAWPHLKRDWPVIRLAIVVMTALAITGTAAPNTMAFFGLQYTEAINALLIQSTSPLIIASWTFLLFRDRLSLGQSIGILISLTGVLTIICRGDPHALLAVTFNIGDIWIVGSLLVFGFYSALAKKRPAVHPLSFLTFNVGWGTLWLVPIYAWEISTGYTMHFDAITVGTLAYVMIFPSLLAYLFFNRGVELIGPNRAAPFMHLTPFFGSALAILVLGERLQMFHVLGYALVLCGIAVATKR